MKTHYHRVGTKLVECYHQWRWFQITLGFVAGQTLGFPVEHFLYEKVYPFTLITKWLGL